MGNLVYAFYNHYTECVPWESEYFVTAHPRIEKRGRYSRKRANAANADVDYINDKNMRFNRKVARFYDKYTAEIKQNLERGTAV